jgi:hypothetical protein
LFHHAAQVNTVQEDWSKQFFGTGLLVENNEEQSGNFLKKCAPRRAHNHCRPPLTTPVQRRARARRAPRQPAPRCRARRAARALPPTRRPGAPPRRAAAAARAPERA